MLSLLGSYESLTVNAKPSVGDESVNNSNIARLRSKFESGAIRDKFDIRMSEDGLNLMAYLLRIIFSYNSDNTAATKHVIQHDFFEHFYKKGEIGPEEISSGKDTAGAQEEAKNTAALYGFPAKANPPVLRPETEQLSP